MTIDTACGHCGKPMRITVDSDMRYDVHGAEAPALVFMPEVDWQAFTAPTIIHAY